MLFLLQYLGSSINHNHMSVFDPPLTILLNKAYVAMWIVGEPFPFFSISTLDGWTSIPVKLITHLSPSLFGCSQSGEPPPYPCPSPPPENCCRWCRPHCYHPQALERLCSCHCWFIISPVFYSGLRFYLPVIMLIAQLISTKIFRLHKGVKTELPDWTILTEIVL